MSISESMLVDDIKVAVARNIRNELLLKGNLYQSLVDSIQSAIDDNDGKADAVAIADRIIGD